MRSDTRDTEHCSHVSEVTEGVVGLKSAETAFSSERDLFHCQSVFGGFSTFHGAEFVPFPFWIRRKD